MKRLCSKRVISTYLDNDDALNVGFIDDLQQKVATISDDTFIYYDDGYQLYTDYKYMMQIHYPRNHFVSYVEKDDPTTVKGVFRHAHIILYTPLKEPKSSIFKTRECGVKLFMRRMW